MEKVAVLFNPSSGRGLSLRKKDEIIKKLKKNSIPFNWFESDSENHLKQLAKEKAESYKTILVVGGDTSFQIAASEIYQSPYNPALCMMPTGSANDIAISLCSNSFESILKSLKESKTKRMDMVLLEIKGKSEKIFFAGSLSLGLGVTVNQYITNYWKQHPLQAKQGKLFQVMAGFLGAIESFKQKRLPMKINLSSEDFEQNFNFSIAVFSNVPSYAGGLRVNPHASPFDGKINCCVIDTKSFNDSLKMAYSVWRKKHANKRETKLFSKKSFMVTSDEPINIQYDGNVILGVKEFKVSVLPSAIKILG
jgi:diacylglycerol kinase (ATP)